jgi:hypothetical protein
MSIEELATRFPPEQPTPPVAGEKVALAGLADGDDAEVTPAGPEPAGEDETR